MGTNSDLYLIGIAVLIFLIIVFLYLRKISNSGKLKVKIEEVPESFKEDKSLEIEGQQAFEFNEEEIKSYEEDQEKKYFLQPALTTSAHVRILVLRALYER